MQKSTEFSLCEIVFVAVNSVITKLFLIFPATLIEVGKSASLLLTIFITVIAYGVLMLIALLYKKFENKSILSICDYAFGKWGKVFYRVVLSLLFLIICGTFLRCVSESISLSLMPDININIISLTFISGVSIAVFSGLKGIVRCHGVIVPITLTVVIILFLGSVSSFEINNMFPLFADGVSTFVIGSLLCSFFTDCIIITLIIPYTKKDVTVARVFNLSTVVSFLALITVVSAVLFATDDNTFIPVFKLGQNFKAWEYTPRLESVFTAAWFLSFFLNFSLLLYFACKLMSGKKSYKPLIIPFAFIVFAISVIPKDIIILTKCLDIISVARLIILFALPIIALAVANIKVRRGKL